MDPFALVAAGLAAASPHAQTPPLPTPARGTDSRPQAAPRPTTLDLPLELDGVPLGDVVAVIGEDDVRVQIARIADLLAARIGADGRAALARLRGEAADGLVGLSALAAAGVNIAYRPDTLTLVASLAAEDRGVQSLSLQAFTPLDPMSGIPPSGLSAGVSLIGHAAHVHARPGGGGGWEPLALEATGFVALGGFEAWTLLWGVDFDAGRSRRFQRRDVTLVRDDFETATRLSIGDFRTRAQSAFQRSIDLVGVNWRRDYAAIQPFRTLLPRGRGEFTLERPGRVQVEIDGVVVFDRRLQPGGYDIRDFPFATGANVARILVDDGSGPREVSALSAFVDTDLLAEGITRFDIGAGFISDGFAAPRRYRDEPAVVASFDHGLTAQVTVGGHLEGSPEGGQAGASVAVGTPIGLVVGEGVFSWSEEHGTGYALAAQYRTQFDTDRWHHTLIAQATLRDAGFGGLSVPIGAERTFDMRVTSQRDTLGLNASLSLRRLAGIDTGVASAGVTWRTGRLSWAARWQSRWSDLRPTEHLGTLSVSIPVGSYGRVRAVAETSGEGQIEYQRYGPYAVGETQVRALAQRIDGRVSGNARIQHIANRFEIEIDHQSADTRNGLSSRTAITPSIGIGFADGAVQFGRPFDAGFIIAGRHPTLGDRRVAFNEGFLGTAAHTDALGAALIPLRSSYRTYDYTIDVADLPVGYDLGSGTLRAVPGLRAGYRHQVGSAAAATVVARLQNADGTPIALATGRVTAQAGGAPEQRVFTNRTGRVVVDGLAPGRYTLTLDQRPGVSWTIEVPADASGLIDLGPLTAKDLP